MSKLRLARFIVIAGSLVGAVGCAPFAQPPAAAGSAFTACANGQRDAEGGGRVDVEICAAPNANTIGSGNAGAGRIVAQIKNLDLVRKEARWGLEPGQTYLVIVSRGNRFQIVGPGDADNIHRTGEYYKCVPERPRPANSEAYFGTCQDRGHVMASPAAGVVAEQGGPSDKVGHSDEPMRTSLGVFNGPAWISCPTGCCTTERQ